MKNINKTALVVIFLLICLSAVIFYFRVKSDSISSFKCPENYETPEAYVDSLARWISETQKINPELTVDELMAERYDQLKSNNCQQALLNIGRINTSNTIINFAGKEYGPYVAESNDFTMVSSAFYPIRGQRTGEAEEEIIFNFYFQGVWANKLFSARDLADQIAGSNMEIENKFEAPDPINKEPAFFFIASSVYPDKGYGYVYFIKVASIYDDVYSVMLSKRITGDKDNLQNNVNTWMLDNMEVKANAIVDMGPDDSWVDYFK